MDPVEDRHADPLTRLTAGFVAERPRLTRIATSVLGDPVEAEDVVQQAWLRLHRATTTPTATPTATDTTHPTGTTTDAGAGPIENLPGWLTTVTTRLCLDRLRRRMPDLVDEMTDLDASAAAAAAGGRSADPADDVALADTVGAALQVVLDRLSPKERVAFVLHDSFGFAFPTIASVLDTTPAAARKLASRARAKVAQPAAEDALADWEVVDAFLGAARGGDFARLLQLLAPDAVVGADEAALLAGTPERISGREEVATFFNGAARAAFSVYVDDRPAAAWIHRGEARVVFDFTIVDGLVAAITFRAAPEVLAAVRRRDREQRIGDVRGNLGD